MFLYGSQWGLCCHSAERDLRISKKYLAWKSHPSISKCKFDKPKNSLNFQHHARYPDPTRMYTLNAVDSFHISDPQDTYVYDIVPVAAGIATISSDDSLRLLDPLALSGAPVNSIRRVNADVTCLKAINTSTEGDALIVCTAGRDGRVLLLDPRTAGKIGEVKAGTWVLSCTVFEEAFRSFEYAGSDLMLLLFSASQKSGNSGPGSIYRNCFSRFSL